LLVSRAQTALKEQETHFSNSLEILRSDCRFIEAYTGVDLISTLAPVRDVHDQVQIRSVEASMYTVSNHIAQSCSWLDKSTLAGGCSA